MYEIEKNVPVEKPAFGRWQRLADRMQSGDSVLVKDSNEATGLAGAIRKSGRRAASRKQPDDTVRVFVL